MTVLVVGSVALDTLETPFGKREDALGGSATFFSTAASLLASVRLVAVIGEDFPEKHVDMLRSRKVDLSGLSRVPGGKTFRWSGRYGTNLNEAQTLDTQLNVFATFSPELPPSFRDTPFVFLANIHPALQLDVLKQVNSPKLVAMDTMNFWITGENAALKKVIAKADILTINDGEARLLAGEHNVVKAAKGILKMGVKALIVKRGEYGALYFDHEHAFWAPAFPLEDVFDPTGAGDTFAGGLMGYLAHVGAISHVHLRQAIVTGSVLASFTVEDFSVDRLVRVTRDELRTRFETFRRLTHFEELSLRELT